VPIPLVGGRFAEGADPIGAGVGWFLIVVSHGVTVVRWPEWPKQPATP
jgi:hypothetical protein